MTWSDDCCVLHTVSKSYNHTMFCGLVLVHNSKILCQLVGAGCEICFLSLNYVVTYENSCSMDLIICLNFILNFNTEIREMK